mgnify:CR=1 FL=1
MKTINQFESQFSKEIYYFLKNALDEDFGEEDHTSKSCFKNKTNNSFKLITKSNCIISGIRLSEILIEKFRSNLSIEKFFYDGDQVKKGEKVFYLSPKGKIFNQKLARKLSNEKKINIICGHFEGIDQRVLENRKIEELSIGDFILSGGETATYVFLDAILRLITWCDWQ